MKLCKTCDGIGSVPDPENPGSKNRCRDCGGTGLAPVATANNEPGKNKGGKTPDPAKDKE